MLWMSNAKEFAKHCNTKLPGAWRTVDAADIRLMTECGLIGQYGHYGRGDVETVRGVLRYEMLREKHDKKVDEHGHPKPPLCKGCGDILPDQGDHKRGRPPRILPRM